MNAEGQLIQKTFNQLNGQEKSSLKESYDKLDRLRDSMQYTLKCMCLDNVDIFDRLFYNSYIPKKKLKVLSKYLEVNENFLLVSKHQKDLEDFSLQLMTYETLGRLYLLFNSLYNIDFLEFLLFWVIVNEDGTMIDILFSKELDIKELDDDTLEVMKEKEIWSKAKEVLSFEESKTKKSKKKKIEH